MILLTKSTLAMYVFCNFIGSMEFPVEFTQSGPKSLDLPPSSHMHPESNHFLVWGVAKVKHTRLVFNVCTREQLRYILHIIYQDIYTELVQKYLADILATAV